MSGGLRCASMDDQSIEVTVSRGGSINAVFSQLENAGVVVTSMRNKTNRLEQYLSTNWQAVNRVVLLCTLITKESRLKQSS